MSAIAQQPDLLFSRSQSRAVGVEHGLMASMQRYAPRIVSTLKLGTYGAFLSSGLAAGSVLIIGAGVALLASAAIMIFYGDKEKQKARAEKAAAQPSENMPTDPVSRLMNGMGKIFSPSQHPVEAASALSLLSSALIMLQGALTGNVYFIGIGLFASIASGIALFGREKPKAPAEALKFQQSRSTALGLEGTQSKGLVQSLKGNPIRVSALLLMITGSFSLAGGIAESDPFLIAAGVCGMISNVIMALFVKKNDYNVDSIKNAHSQPAPDTQVRERTLHSPLQLPPHMAPA